MSRMDEYFIKGGFMKIKLSIENATKLWMFGLLFTPYILRSKFMPDVFAAGNFISLLGMILALHKVGKRTDNFEKIIMIFVAFSFMLCVINSADMRSIVKIILSTFLPIGILHISRIENNRGYIIFKTALIFFNVMAYILLFIVVIDFLTNHSMSTNIASFLNTQSVIGQARDNRLVSFFGHSLNSMLFMLGYFILHILDALYVSKHRKILAPTIISMIVIAATGSKTGLILIMATIIICYGNRKMVKYIPIMAVAVFVMFKYGVLDLVLGRLSIGIQSGDITTDRVTYLTRLMKTGAISFDLFKGHDASLINNSVAMIGALENPILRWAFRYGVLFAALMSISILIIPLLKVIKIGKVRIALLAVIYIIAINAFDTICSIGDSMLMYCTVIVLITIAGKITSDKMGDKGTGD